MGGAIAVAVLGLDDAGVQVLGPLPHGLPSFVRPWTSFADLGPVVIGGFAVAIQIVEARDLIAAEHANLSFHHAQPERLMQAGGETMIVMITRDGGVEVQKLDGAQVARRPRFFSTEQHYSTA
ncbi:hypothetical protein B4Q13_19910 [Lacticaseibacillus rhamnosus]